MRIAALQKYNVLSVDIPRQKESGHVTEHSFDSKHFFCLFQVLKEIFVQKKFTTETQQTYLYLSTRNTSQHQTNSQNFAHCQLWHTQLSVKQLVLLVFGGL